MGSIWSMIKSVVLRFKESPKIPTLPLFRWRFNLTTMKEYAKIKLDSYNHFEMVICNEIDEANRKSDNQSRAIEGDDFLPNCDLTVWLRDCKMEVLEPLKGTTTGEIPLWLNGTLLRNGPGGMTVGNYSFNHLFDCSALLHRFHILNGKATYQCRFLKSNTYKTNHSAQRIVISEFGTKAVPDPCRTIFQRFAAVFKLEEESDNCLVSVYPFGDEIYTLTEQAVMHRIDPQTLDTIGKIDVKKVANIIHHTSHPHVGEDGLVHNIGLSIQPTGPIYTIVQFPNTKKGLKPPKNVFSEAQLVAGVRSRWPFNPSYMHTFGITKSFFIIVEQPMCVSVKAKLATQFNNKPLSNILKWEKEYPTLIHVLYKKSGECVATYLAEPFFYLHIINQYEENNHIVIDICAYKDPTMLDCMLIESLKTAKHNPDYSKMFRGRPVRFVLPMNIDKRRSINLVTLKNTNAQAYWTDDDKIFVIPELLCDMGCETPKINYPKFLGNIYQYFYAISADVDLESPGTLIKVDVVNKTKTTWTEVGSFPSEPIFVPSPNQKDEDDGVILSTLLWGKERTKTALIILDAKTFVELGRTVFDAPGPVPKCLHGWYWPDEENNRNVMI